MENPTAIRLTKISKLPPVLKVTLKVQLDVEMFFNTTTASSPTLEEAPETIVAVTTGLPLKGGYDTV
jgi:hypothetical protein